MAEQSAVRAVRAYLSALRSQGLDVSFGVLFGSQVTGKATQLSDIDVLIVSPRFESKRTRADINLLWRVAARTDSRIEPIPCGDHQWRNDLSSPIVEIARREGTVIVN